MCLSSSIDRMRCFRLAKKWLKSVRICENGSRFWWKRRAGDFEAPLPPKRQRRRWSDRVANRRGERRQEFPPCLAYLFHIYHHKREEEEEEEIIITGKYVCMHVFVRVLFVFEVLRMVVFCCWSGGRKIDTYTSCLFVCFFFSLEVLLQLLLLLQILENVYQLFWFEGGMACSHLGRRKL